VKIGKEQKQNPVIPQLSGELAATAPGEGVALAGELTAGSRLLLLRIACHCSPWELAMGNLPNPPCWWRVSAVSGEKQKEKGKRGRNSNDCEREWERERESSAGGRDKCGACEVVNLTTQT
jgi:hypothetical protein